MILRITYKDGSVAEWPVQAGMQISGDMEAVELVAGGFPKHELTYRQNQVYKFIISEIDRRGIPPSVREIAAHLGSSSTNGVICHLGALEKKGVIRRHKGSRGIQLLND